MLRLSIVIPVGPGDDRLLADLLASLRRQTMPRTDYEILCIREGNSEEAKAIGIHQSRGAIIGLFCTDNILVEPDFLEVMTHAASQAGVVGAYTARYAYVKEDTALSRYFALLGANDSLVWWLGKSDRQDALQPAHQDVGQRTFTDPLPSLGDNGCFYKGPLLRDILPTPETFGSCMCLCEDLRRQGHATWNIISSHAIWHRSGASFLTYVKKRWRYVNTLYWQRLPIRRWRPVSTLSDWIAVGLFAAASSVVVPHLFLSLRGYRRKPDAAWFLHPFVCGCLTWLYTWALLRYVWSSARSTVLRNWHNVWSR